MHKSWSRLSLTSVAAPVARPMCFNAFCIYIAAQLRQAMRHDNSAFSRGSWHHIAQERFFFCPRCLEFAGRGGASAPANPRAPRAPGHQEAGGCGKQAPHVLGLPGEVFQVRGHGASLRARCYQAGSDRGLQQAGRLARGCGLRPCAAWLSFSFVFLFVCQQDIPPTEVSITARHASTILEEADSLFATLSEAAARIKTQVDQAVAYQQK